MVSAANGSRAIGLPASDAVDGDDGVVDGSGSHGNSRYPGAKSVSFTFAPAGPGHTLPTHVGVVWTDVGVTLDGRHCGQDEVTFVAFDGANVALGSRTVAVGDADIHGQAAEHRFFGVIAAGGIGRITLTMADSADWALDHLQFGTAPVPLPAAVWLFGGAVGGAELTAARRAACRAVIGHDPPMSDIDADPITIPHHELSATALRGVIEAFVLREGTDYGEAQHSLADKVAQVLRQLARNEAQILFDPVNESIDIVATDKKSTPRSRR